VLPNIKCDFNKRHFIAPSHFWFCVYAYVLYELFFFIDNVVRLLFYVNTYACHVNFTITLLTYLLRDNDDDDDPVTRRVHWYRASASQLDRLAAKLGRLVLSESVRCEHSRRNTRVQNRSSVPFNSCGVNKPLDLRRRGRLLTQRLIAMHHVTFHDANSRKEIRQTLDRSQTCSIDAENSCTIALTKQVCVQQRPLAVNTALLH